MDEIKFNGIERHEIQFDGDMMSIYGLIGDLNEILSPHGITLTTDPNPHDGYDICIVEIEK